MTLHDLQRNIKYRICGYSILPVLLSIATECSVKAHYKFM